MPYVGGGLGVPRAVAWCVRPCARFIYARLAQSQPQPPADWVHEGQDVCADLAMWQGGVGMHGARWWRWSGE